MESELVRLYQQSRREHGPEWPPPADEAAYLLLAGLAAQGQPIEKPSADERTQFGLDGSNASVRKRLIAVGADARLVESITSIQDKSGSYRILSLSLYRKQNGQWSHRGAGMTAGGAASALPTDAEKAKAALLRLLRSDGKRIFVGSPDPDRMEKIALESLDFEEPQHFNWGGFRIDIEKRTYQADAIGKHDGWFYSGTFQVDSAGQWTAGKPDVVHALGLHE